MKSSSEKKKSVCFSSPETNIYHPDKLRFEERSKLWCTTEDLVRYQQDALESIDAYRAFLVDGKTSSLDPNTCCTRGLEAYCETNNIVTKTQVREYYVDCVLDLQDELFDIEEGGPGMAPERREKLIRDIKKLDALETAKVLRRASRDRSAADQIHEEENEKKNRSSAAKTKINVRAERFSLSRELLGAPHDGNFQKNMVKW